MPPARLDRSLIRVSGPDAAPFLQNLLTQEIDARTPLAYAALLTPQGKVLADMFVWAEADGFVLDADPARGADLLRRLTMYKLRANVALADASGERRVVVSDAPFAGALPDPRLPALGWRGFGDPSDIATSFAARQLALGVPDLAQAAAPDEVFALEALLEELNGVAFQKGCFVGQENVSRMKRRGTTRKKFCPIVFDGEAPARGTPLRVGEAEVGTVRSGAPGRAMALVRLDRALDAASAGKVLVAGELPVRLDPPAWLVLPSREALPD